MLNAATSTPLIAQGTHAGQPRDITDIMLDRVTAARAAVLVLRNSGFKVTNIHIGAGVSPAIEIKTCARCAELDGHSVKWSHDYFGPYTLMEAKLEGCRVHWLVMGH